jgi:hypothetical protein
LCCYIIRIYLANKSRFSWHSQGFSKLIHSELGVDYFTSGFGIKFQYFILWVWNLECLEVLLMLNSMLNYYILSSRVYCFNSVTAVMKKYWSVGIMASALLVLYLSIHLHLVPRLSMHEALPPLTHTSCPNA